MLRSNSPKIHRAVDAYLTGEILDNLKAYDDFDGERPATTLLAIVDRDLRSHPYQTQRELVTQYIQAAAITTPWTDERRAMIVTWFEVTPAEDAHLSASQIDKLFEHMICDSWERLVKRENA